MTGPPPVTESATAEGAAPDPMADDPPPEPPVESPELPLSPRGDAPKSGE